MDQKVLSQKIAHIFGSLLELERRLLYLSNQTPSRPFRESSQATDNFHAMGNKISEPEPGESIISRHKQRQESRNRYVQRARDGKRKLAAAQGIAIPRWEEYWKELDEWWDFVMEQDIDRELYQNGLAPTPPTAPIPRPHKPGNLEKVGGNSKE